MTSVDFAQLEARIEQYAAEIRRTRTEQLGEESVTWLALLPQWTTPLARHCEFPSSVTLAEWLEDAIIAGVCQRQALGDYDDAFGFDDDEDAGAPECRFWMPEPERSQVLTGARRKKRLRQLAADIAERVEAAPGEIAIDPGLQRWVSLARRAPEDPRAGEWLMDQVADAVAGDRMADALDWVYAGEALGPILGEEVASAAARAKRLINLEYRRRVDARFLERFYAREDQRAAVERVLENGDGEPWALHFVGMGGAGKTMLVRYISSSFKRRDGREVVAARVDFDHISPRYPVEEPGQLLRELAAGLAGHLLEADQVNAYRHFTDCADVLDKITKTKTGRGGVDSAEFEAALDAFAALIREIKQPVVLILDTCEELAKHHPAGDHVPSVERTFEILERLHAKLSQNGETAVNDVRVILAGRRLLASRYADWPPAGTDETVRAVSPATRDYAALFEVRGFTETEARALVDMTRTHKMAREVEDAILVAAEDSGRVDEIAEVTPEEDPEQRYNPFELALYADWFEEGEGKLTAGEIASGDLAAYVEARIIGRLPADPPLGPALAALAILGSIDVHIVREVLGVPDGAAQRAFRVLSDQEWISTRAAEESGVTVLQAQQGLLRRLRSYFERSDKVDELDEAREALRERLPVLLAKRPLDAVAVEHVAGAMRVLDDLPAVELWDGLVERVVGNAEWQWAADACGRLLANDVELGTPRPAIEASVRAVYIGAQARSDPAYDAAADWGFVAKAARRHPTAAGREQLIHRARLGAAAADARHRGRIADPLEPPFRSALERAFGPGVDRERLAAALHWLEAALDASPDALPLPPEGVRGLVDRAIELDDPMVEAFARLQLARTDMRWDGAPKFEDAAQAAPSAAEAGSPVDWPLPEAALARVRLAWLLATIGAPEAAPPFGEMGAWLDDALAGEDIEHERLASAALARLLARGVVPKERVEALDAMVRRVPVLGPLCQAHELTPPLIAGVVRAWVALGDPDRARALIEAWEEASPSIERDAATTAHGCLATLYLIRRMRWRTFRDALVVKLADDPASEVALAARATATLIGEPTADADGTAETGDIWWRTSPALSAGDASNLLDEVVTRLESLPENPIAAAHLSLDRQEAVQLGRRIDREPHVSAAGDVSAAREFAERRLRSGVASPAELREWRAIRLRSWALSSAGEWPDGGDDAGREWAEIALEEGELLALRLPESGGKLLGLAVRCFAEAEDVVGAAIASIRRVIANFHAGSSTPGDPDLQTRYDRLRASVAHELPAWDEVDRSTRAGVESSGAAWDGWTARLATCIKAGRGAVMSSPDGSVELDLGQAAKHAKWFTRLVEPVSTWAAAAWTIVFWFVVGEWLGRKLLDLILGWGPDSILGWVAGFAAFLFVVVAVIGLLMVVATPMMRLVGAQLRLLASVQSFGPPGTDDRALVGLELHTRWWGAVGLAFLCRAAVRLRGRVIATMPASPDPLRAEVPKRLNRAFRGARTLRTHELVLRVAPALSGGAWEAVFGLGQVDESRGMAATIPTLREYPTRGTRPPVRKASCVALLCADPFALSAEEAWGAGDLSPDIFFAEQLPELERRRDIDVLHLIGSPVPGELRPTLALQGTGGDGVLPDRLPLPGPSLIVVQAEPIRSSVTADARSGELRELAHDLAVASRGATVIALPALPSHLATALVSKVAVEVTRERPKRQTYLDLVHVLRARVYEAGQVDEPVSARAVPAFDVCLYVGD